MPTPLTIYVVFVVNLVVLLGKVGAVIEVVASAVIGAATRAGEGLSPSFFSKLFLLNRYLIEEVLW